MHRAHSPLILAGLALACALPAAMAIAQMPPETPERWWKGNLHTHTLWSDGDGFPDVVAGWYRDHGYHFLALSDHNVLSQGELWMRAKAVNRRAGVDAVARYRRQFGDHWVERRGTEEELEVRLKTLEEVRAMVEERGRFLMIPSEELTGAAGDGRSLHMNATNLGERLVFQVGSTIRESMVRNLQMVEEHARRSGRDVLLHVNHPNYKWGLTAEELAAVVDEHFFEVWNGVDNDNDPGDSTRAGTDEIWDIANTLRMLRYGGQPLLGLATDDSHDHHDNKTRAIPGRAWIMVRSRYLTPASIVQAIRRGEFYSSTGVTLRRIVLDGASKRLSLEIEGVAGVEYVTRFIGTRQGAPLTGRPRRGPQGELFDTTLDYSAGSGPQIGEVLAEVPGLNPSYVARGGEFYVRAVVTSNRRPVVESTEFAFERAWTQPVVW
jgi:hypothetical protein